VEFIPNYGWAIMLAQFFFGPPYSIDYGKLFFTWRRNRSP